VIILEGTKVRFADSLEGQRHSVRVTTRAGRAMPAHCTSGGKVMLACLPEDELERRYPGRVLDRPSERCIPEWAELVKELNGIRRRRWVRQRGTAGRDRGRRPRCPGWAPGPEAASIAPAVTEAATRIQRRLRGIR
jgi:DNA-binding IclR family transcriptional regulator